MISMILLIILNILALYYAYISGKKNRENEIISNSINRKNTERIGDIYQIKERLNKNEF